VRFTLAALATWRMTHLLTEEDGPADLVLRLRRTAGQSQLGQVMDCFYCASMWVALPVAAFVAHESTGRVTWYRRAATWLALSGAACLLEQAARSRAGRHEAAEAAA
jgi:Protein of unknown function (DUF1360)